MFTTAPYIIYKCDTCARETEKQLDSRRPDPNRCNITLNCRGKLSRVGERPVKKFLFPSTSSSLNDWRQRGTPKGPEAASTEEEQISLFCANDGSGIVISALHRRSSGPNSVFYTTDADGAELVTEAPSSIAYPVESAGNVVMYEIAPELVKYKKYSYLVNTTVQNVRGPDNSAEKNNLRFSSGDKLKVYVNGVELAPEEYDASSVANEIIFTPMITTITNLVEIVVYEDITIAVTAENTVRLPVFFMKVGDPARGKYCWGDTTMVNVDGQDRFCFFCNDLSSLLPGRSYGLVGLEMRDSTGMYRSVAPTEWSFMLGKHPFGFVDKDLHAYAKAASLVDLNAENVLSFRNSSLTGVPELTTAASGITQVFAPIKLVGVVPATESSPVNPPEGTATLKRKFTLGPT